MLTDVACRKAEARDKPYKLADAHGLHLYVTPNGYKSWRWKYRFAGKEKRLVFGPYPAIKLVEARSMREAAARQLRDGIDPSIEKQQRTAANLARAGATFSTVANDWYDSQRPTWSPRYAKIVRRSLDQDVLPKLGTLPLDAITTPMVLGVLRPIESRGAIETAHRVRQRISEVFARAIASGIATSDPATIAARALSKVKKSKFPAVRTTEAAQAVLRAVEQQPGHPLTKLASRLLALTAVRSGVLRLAEASEFEGLDGPSPIWRIPASKMKLVVERKEDAAFEFIVPLARQSVELVKLAIEFTGPGPLIFRSVRHPRKPLSDSTISKAYREAGFSGVHVPHGWRSTFSTVMNELAAVENRLGDRAIIDLMLAHVPAGVEAAYNRAGYMPRRRVLAQEWADMLTAGLAEPASLLTGPRQHG
jgi:integrase